VGHACEFGKAGLCRFRSCYFKEVTGTTTTIPLSPEYRKPLEKTRRTGLIYLTVAVLVAAGAVIGIALTGTFVFLVFLPVSAFLGWAFYTNGLTPIRTLRAGTLQRYEGPWNERVVSFSVGRQTAYRAQIAIPGLAHALIVRNPPVVNGFRKDGVTENWSPGGGWITYTAVGTAAVNMHRNAKTATTGK
jgi:hypothetical protein